MRISTGRSGIASRGGCEGALLIVRWPAPTCGDSISVIRNRLTARRSTAPAQNILKLSAIGRAEVHEKSPLDRKD
jgi:hypothetical protein